MVMNTPPMGWNTWNTFGENINEQLIMETADAMVEKGLKDAGYEYVVIDDSWSCKYRDENGDLVPDPVKFPHGIKYLADYIHSKGLKLGMYSCCGPLTCAGYPGSLDHEYQDAMFFARNGVDYLKYDWCYHPRNMAGWTLYNRMRMALDATGRDIAFSICNWGEEDAETWVKKVGGNLYRSTCDISDNFDIITTIFKEQENLFCLSGPSCFNDIDMLVCGMYGKGNVSSTGGCTAEEYATHFKLWCMTSSPLMIGCDIRNMDDETAKLLTNKKYIAIDQDAEQRPPIRLGDNRLIALFKHVSDCEYMLSVTNTTNEPMEWNLVSFPEFGFPGNGDWGIELVDIDTEEKRGTFATNVWINDLAPHQTRIYRCKVVKLR